MSEPLRALTNPVEALRHALDRTVAPPLTNLVQSEEAGALAAVAFRAQRAVGDRLEHVSRRLLHLVNLPAASDINRLLRHLAQVERQVRDLRNELGDLRDAARPDDHR